MCNDPIVRCYCYCYCFSKDRHFTKILHKKGNNTSASRRPGADPNLIICAYVKDENNKETQLLNVSAKSQANSL